MDITSIVNAMQPNTISCFALNETDFPNGGNGTPFMGGFVQLFPGAVLPTEDAVTAYESTYNTNIAAVQSAQQEIYILPDIPTRLANVESALVSLGATLSTAQITAANNTLSAIGQPTIVMASTSSILSKA